MFSKVLIANRGEIAVRIAHTCREMGIETVGIYSAADEGALHVRMVDEAYCVGSAPALQSYLCQEAILEVARRSGVDAVHPGYGFLAENAEFARAVEDAGLTWIGPPSEVVALMGDKVAAKRLAESAGVPVLPGYFDPDQSVARLQSEAERIGYPIMIKAAAGGGGKGMRTVTHPVGFVEAAEGAAREAASAFGDGRIMLEKLLINPRHVEIQVLADAGGAALHLGERECSIQRRHQKIVEESPSPIMTRELRALMGADALRLVRASGYVNAGTVEFLFDSDRYYFLEMNTRIQVEHPVTEMVTGLDLVRLQLEIASGLPLALSQLDVQLAGHAIEARMYAEDPDNGFLPSAGTISVFRPSLRPGCRIDAGVSEGAEVPTHYDPMLAKLIVHGNTRQDVVARLRDAIESSAILGVTSNLGFLKWLVHQPEFVAGRTDIGLVDRCWKPSEINLPEEVLLAAAAYEISDTQRNPEPSAPGDGDPYNPWRLTGSWRPGGLERRLSYLFLDQARDVIVLPADDGGWSFDIDGQKHTVRVDTHIPGEVLVLDGERVLRFAVARGHDGIDVAWLGQTYLLRHGSISRTHTAPQSNGTRDAGLTSPMPGTVVKVAVQPGEEVAEHQTLVVLEAMKMEHAILAPHAGVVREVFFHEGDLVPAGSPLLGLDPQ